MIGLYRKHTAGLSGPAVLIFYLKLSCSNQARLIALFCSRTRFEREKATGKLLKEWDNLTNVLESAHWKSYFGEPVLKKLSGYELFAGWQVCTKPAVASTAAAL